MSTIAAAGNTDYPALWVILKKGFSIDKFISEKYNAYYKASKNGHSFFAMFFLEILGLIYLHEIRDCKWKLNEEELVKVQSELQKAETKLGVDKEEFLASFYKYLDRIYGKININYLTVYHNPNTNYTALWVLLHKEYTIEVMFDEEKTSISGYDLITDYEASKGKDSFYATDFIKILGLIALWESRGDDWKLEKDEAKEIRFEMEKVEVRDVLNDPIGL